MNCIGCGFQTNNVKFCSRSCATRHNNMVPKRKKTKACSDCPTLIRSGWKRCAPCAEKHRPRVESHRICPTCKTPFESTSRTFCSDKCIVIDLDAVRAKSRIKYLERYEVFVQEWKAGNLSGGRGRVGSGSLSMFLRRYLFEKFGSKCCKCGWAEINPATGKSPLHVDHINGDWSDHSETNLQLLCPNCHSITPNFGSLNRGRGRHVKVIAT